MLESVLNVGGAWPVWWGVHLPARSTSDVREATSCLTANEDPDMSLPELAHHPDYEVVRELDRGSVGIDLTSRTTG